MENIEMKHINEILVPELANGNTPVELRMVPCYGGRYVMLMYRAVLSERSHFKRIKKFYNDWRPLFQFFDGDPSINGGLWCEITHDYYKENIQSVLDAYKGKFRTMGDIMAYTDKELERKSAYDAKCEAYLKRAERLFY